MHVHDKNVIVNEKLTAGTLALIYNVYTSIIYKCHVPLVLFSSPAVFLSSNPSLQRHYERRTAKIDADRRHRQQSLERAQKVFFLHQAFDHDSNLRFGQQVRTNY